MARNKTPGEKLPGPVVESSHPHTPTQLFITPQKSVLRGSSILAHICDIVSNNRDMHLL